MTVAPNSPKPRSQASNSPERVAGQASGKLILRNVADRPCPSVAATPSSTGSTAEKADRAATIRNGAATKIWASTIPANESVRPPPVRRPSGERCPSRNRISTPDGRTGNCSRSLARTVSRHSLRAEGHHRRRGSADHGAFEDPDRQCRPPSRRRHRAARSGRRRAARQALDP